MKNLIYKDRISFFQKILLFLFITPSFLFVFSGIGEGKEGLPSPMEGVDAETCWLRIAQGADGYKFQDLIKRNGKLKKTSLGSLQKEVYDLMESDSLEKKLSLIETPKTNEYNEIYTQIIDRKCNQLFLVLLAGRQAEEEAKKNGRSIFPALKRVHQLAESQHKWYEARRDNLKTEREEWGQQADLLTFLVLIQGDQKRRVIGGERRNHEKKCFFYRGMIGAGGCILGACVIGGLFHWIGGGPLKRWTENFYHRRVQNLPEGKPIPFLDRILQRLEKRVGVGKIAIGMMDLMGCLMGGVLSFFLLSQIFLP